MHYLQGLVVACFLASGSAHAAYATMSPPPGWSAGGSAAWTTPSNSFAAQTANQWINNAARTSAMLNIGGKQVAIQARLGLGPSAGRIIAAAIYNHPGVRTAVGIASLLGTAKIIYDEADRQWKQVGSSSDVISDGKEYRLKIGQLATSWTLSIESACSSGLSILVSGGYVNTSDFNWSYDGIVSGQCAYRGKYNKPGTVQDPFNYRTPESRTSSCSAGSYVSNGACSPTPQSKPLTQKQMVELLDPDNHVGWPTTVPNELPLGTPLPVTLPVVNPSTGVNPFPRPQFVPTGDPVKNPNYDPAKPQTADNQPFIQPGVNITPRPTTANPWQVDIQPVERPQPTADPLPDDKQNPDTQEGDKPKEEDSKSLCEKHPDILACQKVKLGEVEPKSLAKNTVALNINREEGFGPADGACPSPKEFVIMGKSMAFRWDLLCDFATQIRPLLVGFAYLSAILAFFGLSRKD